MIKAVIFDYGNVISVVDNGKFFAALRPYSSKTDGEWAAVYMKWQKLQDRYEAGRISSDEFFRQASRISKINVPRGKFIKEFTSIFTPIIATRKLISRLKKRYLLGLLSNTNEWDFKHAIRKTDIFPLFDAVTLSFRVKAMKPNRKIYLDMLKKLGISPEECAYIDDLQENVDAASQLGMHGIHFTSPQKLEKDLRALGIVF